MDCFVAHAPRNDKHPRSRGVNRPGPAHRLAPRKIRGRRECRVLFAPAASHAVEKMHTSKVTASTPNIPAFPARWCTAYTRSPRGAGLVSPRPPRIITRELMPASGHQDHATSPSASPIARQPMPKRPSHPAPRVVTTAIRPSDGAGPRQRIIVFCKTEDNYFVREGLTQAEIDSGKQN
jgi:hypothetical protein